MSKSKNNRKNGKSKSGNMYVGNKHGFKKTKTIPYASQKTIDSGESAVQLFIDTLTRFYTGSASQKDLLYMNGLEIGNVDKNNLVPDSIMKVIMLKIPKTKVKLTQKEIEQCGTGMFPKDCGFWVVGSYGSIWLDVEFHGVMYRLSFYDKKPYPSIGIENLSAPANLDDIDKLIETMFGS